MTNFLGLCLLTMDVHTPCVLSMSIQVTLIEPGIGDIGFENKLHSQKPTGALEIPGNSAGKVLQYLLC